jgi:hypothetical protein
MRGVDRRTAAEGGRAAGAEHFGGPSDPQAAPASDAEIAQNHPVGNATRSSIRW